MAVKFVDGSTPGTVLVPGGWVSMGISRADRFGILLREDALLDAWEDFPSSGLGGVISPRPTRDAATAVMDVKVAQRWGGARLVDWATEAEDALGGWVELNTVRVLQLEDVRDEVAEERRVASAEALAEQGEGETLAGRAIATAGQTVADLGGAAKGAALDILGSTRLILIAAVVIGGVVLIPNVRRLFTASGKPTPP